MEGVEAILYSITDYMYICVSYKLKKNFMRKFLKKKQP